MKKNKLVIIFFIFLLTIETSHQEDCWNYNNENSCSGDQREYPESWGNRVFQTPPRGHKNWKPSYQDMNLIVGYIQMKYSPDDSQVTLTFIHKLNSQNIPLYSFLTFVFGEYESHKNVFVIKKEDSAQYKEGLKVSARIKNYVGQIVASLDLDLIYLKWNNYDVNQPSNYENGQKGAIVELFGWPYEDTAEECEFLHNAGYLGVKVFPPSEAILNFDGVEDGQLNPWHFIYQPVSYRLTSRMGTRAQLKAMIDKCRSLGVRVYADAVINHMAGNGNDMSPDHRNQSGGSCVHWGPKNSSGGSPWYTTGYLFQLNEFSGEKPGLEFPSVPYDSRDFHCERALTSWSDGIILNYGWLVGLTDLNTERDYVRQRIADYLTDLISIGFSGIRIDAAKHISPENLSHIFAKLKDNLGGKLPEDFIAYLEVLFGGEKDLLLCGDSWYSYGKNFENKMREVGLTDEDIDKIKIWGNDYPKEFPICGQYTIQPKRFAIGLDCHDDQFPGSSSRDMGDKGSVLVKERNVDKHRNFSVELFTRHDDGWKIKLILSSYTFIDNVGAYGFPDGNSDCSKCASENCKKYCTKSMPYSKAFDPNSKGYDCLKDGNWQQGVYTRVHRDQSIVNAMRSWMGLNQLTENELYNTEHIKFLEK